MKKLILSISAILALSACSSIPFFNDDLTPPVTFENFEYQVSDSSAGLYVSQANPLNEQFIGVPFLFDGHTLLLNNFDLSGWKSKRFLRVDGKDFAARDSYLIDMKSGDVRQLNSKKGEPHFQALLQSLAFRLSPMRGLEGTPELLVLINMVEVDGKASVLVIEDPLNSKIHGFIESALVSPRMSRTLFPVEQ